MHSRCDKGPYPIKAGPSFWKTIRREVGLMARAEATMGGGRAMAAWYFNDPKMN